MLGEFVRVYPDELLMNTLARLANKMRLTHRSFTRTIFGRRVSKVLVDFPCHLDDLITNMPIGHPFTADRFINDHTLFRYYQPFLPAKRAESLLNYITRESDQMQGYTRPKAGHLGFLRFCYDCVENDKREYGETFWHRIHQIPGVCICAEHGTVLQNSHIPFLHRLTHQVYISAEQVLKEVKPYPNPFPPATYQVLQKLATDAKWLLTHNNRHISLESILDRFQIVLADRRLATFNGTIRVPPFLAEFKAFYPADLLTLLDCTIKHEASYEAWPTALLKSKYLMGHPFRYLLVIHFLGYSAESFFAIPPQVSYFGAGPWPCLNPTCVNYQKRVIPEYRLHYRRSDTRPQATFACACGFEYERTGPDTGEADHFRLDRVKTFGPVWETHFQQLFTDPVVSRAEIAQQLQISPGFVGDYARKLNLVPQRNVSGCQIQDDLTFETKRAEKRAVWTEALQKYPEATVSELITDPEVHRAYQWLLSYDRQWHQESSLITQKSPRARTRRYYSERYWQNFDLKLAESIHSVGMLLLGQQERPVQLRKTAITNHLNQTNTNLQSARLPLARRTLGTMEESYEAFALRCLEWTAADLAKQGLSLTRKALIETSKCPYFFRHPQWKTLSQQVLEHLLSHRPVSPSLVHTLLPSISKEWPVLDEEMRIVVEKAAHDLKQRPGYPTKISIVAIAMEIDKVELLLRHLEMLPRTAKLLARITETDEIFVSRVVEWVIEHDPEFKNCSHLMDFINLTGLHPYTNIPTVSKIISDAFARWQTRKQVSPVKPAIDWVARDKMLVQAVIQTAATLRARSNPFVRITVRALSRLIDTSDILDVTLRPLLLNHHDKIPETVRTIKELVETQEQFNLRRLYAVAEQFRQRGRRLYRSHLAKYAGIYHPEASPLIDKAVREVLETFASFPSKSKVTPITQHEKTSDKWQQLDLKLADCVEVAARAIREQRAPLVWVNQTSVSKRLRQWNFIRRNLDRLPKTASTLAQVTETGEEFALRRIKWGEEYYQNKKICPSKNQFMAKAGLSHMAPRPVIQAAVEAALNTLAVFPPLERKPKEQSWQDLDDEYSRLVEPAANALKEQKSPPVWVSKSAIVKHIGAGKLTLNHLKNLPQTLAALTQVVETAEEYTLRRIAICGARFRERQLCPTKEEFAYEAGIHKQNGNKSAIRAAVLEMLQSLAVFPSYTEGQARKFLMQG